jgi:hypothetical protein
MPRRPMENIARLEPSREERIAAANRAWTHGNFMNACGHATPEHMIGLCQAYARHRLEEATRADLHALDESGELAGWEAIADLGNDESDKLVEKAVAAIHHHLMHGRLPPEEKSAMSNAAERVERASQHRGLDTYVSRKYGTKDVKPASPGDEVDVYISRKYGKRRR